MRRPSTHASEVDLDHLRRCALGQRALGQHAALVQHRHLAGAMRQPRRTPCRARPPPANARLRATGTARRCARSPRRSCRPPARRAAAASAPASAACRSPATASGRATAARRCAAPASLQVDQRQHLADAVELLAGQPRRTARRARRGRPSAPARGSRTPRGARTPWASGTCGRCRRARSAVSRQAQQVDGRAEEAACRRRAASCR